MKVHCVNCSRLLFLKQFFKELKVKLIEGNYNNIEPEEDVD